ncbi:MAG: MFS transporter [Bacillales bacterium]|nr:MFS transporter [Bacillales bacterium]
MKHNQSFRLLWISQSIANLGDSFYILAIVTFIYNRTGSAAFAGLFPILRVCAQAIGGLAAPLLMDRLRLDTLLWMSEMGQTICFGLMFALYFSFPSQWLIPTFLFLVFIISILHGWATPARNALVPRLVSPQFLVKANSLLSTSDQIVLLIGWSLGGILVAGLGVIQVIGMTAMMMFFSTLTLFFVKDPSTIVPSHQVRQKQWDRMKEGWITIWRNPILRTLSFMEIISGLGESIWAGSIILVFVKEILHKDENWWGFINASNFAGTILGGLLIWKLSNKMEKRMMSSMLIGSFSIGVFTMAFAFSSNPWFALGMALIIGPPYQLRNIAQRTLLQFYTPEELLPKVLAAFGTIIFVTFGFSVLLMGWMADHWGVRFVYILTAGLYVFSAAYTLMVMKNSSISIQTQRDEKRYMNKIE